MGSIRQKLTQYCEDISYKIVSECTGNVLTYACNSLHNSIAAISLAELSQEKRSILYYAFAEYVILEFDLDIESAIPNPYGYTPYTFAHGFGNIHDVVSAALNR